MAEKITTYNAAVSYLNDTPRFTQKHTIEQTKELLSYLGSPQESFRVIHVAGSNGKGSVCTALSSILNAAGFSCGLFTSPHLMTTRERIRTDGKMISEEAFLEDFLQIREMLSEHPRCPHPTYFEFLFLMAVIRFQKEGVRTAVLETGLGGRLDATNAVEKPDVTVITSISLEHTEYLGDTIGQIAAEKAGIIKEGVPVFYDGSSPEAARVIRRTALERGAPACEIGPDRIRNERCSENGLAFTCIGEYDRFHLQAGVPARYQIRNMALAACAAECVLMQKDTEQDTNRGTRDFRMTESARAGVIEEGIARCRFPGRMEKKAGGIFLDGAHNPAGMDAFLNSVRVIAREKSVLVFACMKDKNAAEMVRQIVRSGLFDVVIATGTDSPRAADPTELYKRFCTYMKSGVYCIPDPEAAICKAAALRTGNRYIFAAGSLYLIGILERIL